MSKLLEKLENIEHEIIAGLIKIYHEGEHIIIGKVVNGEKIITDEGEKVIESASASPSPAPAADSSTTDKAAKDTGKQIELKVDDGVGTKDAVAK